MKFQTVRSIAEAGVLKIFKGNCIKFSSSKNCFNFILTFLKMFFPLQGFYIFLQGARFGFKGDRFEFKPVTLAFKMFILLQKWYKVDAIDKTLE